MSDFDREELAQLELLEQYQKNLIEENPADGPDNGALLDPEGDDPLAAEGEDL